MTRLPTSYSFIVIDLYPRHDYPLATAAVSSIFTRDTLIHWLQLRCHRFILETCLSLLRRCHRFIPETRLSTGYIFVAIVLYAEHARLHIAASLSSIYTRDTFFQQAAASVSSVRTCDTIFHTRLLRFHRSMFGMWYPSRYELVPSNRMGAIPLGNWAARMTVDSTSDI